MDLRDLKLFLYLADCRHFGRTARACHISPSTLSRQIQRLEDEVGQTLFLRDNRTVHMTDAGRQLRLFAQQTLTQYQQLRDGLGNNGARLSGELRLFCSVTAAYSHLPPILDRFRAQYPLVEIKLTTGDAANAMDKIQSLDADLAIAGRPEALPPTVDFIKISEIPLVLIIPAFPCPVHTQVMQVSPQWTQIPFILPEHGPTRRCIDQWFGHYQITHPKIYATVAGHEAIVSMVALGCGVALIPCIVLENSPDTIHNRIRVLDHLFHTAPFDLGVCVQKKRLTEPLIDAFWQLLPPI